jgi:hypothetical protein
MRLCEADTAMFTGAWGFTRPDVCALFGTMQGRDGCAKPHLFDCVGPSGHVDIQATASERHCWRTTISRPACRPGSQ